MTRPFPSFRSIASTCLGLLAIVTLAAHAPLAQAAEADKLCSPGSRGDLEVEFVNNSSQPVSFHWMGFDCSEGGGPSLAPGAREKGTTHPGHIFRARGEGGALLTTFVASNDNLVFVVDDRMGAQTTRHSGEQEFYTESTCSPKTQGRFTVEFINLLNEPITMQWVGFDCKIHVLRQIPAKGRTEETTFPGHVFRFVDSTGRQLRALDVDNETFTYHISDD
jgi:hypothetical protein